METTSAKSYPCGEFTATINSHDDIRINAKGKYARHPERLKAIAELVKELIAAPEDCVCRKHFISILKKVSVRIYEPDNNVKILVEYDHDDGEQHPHSEYDHRGSSYSVIYIENGKCKHIHPSLIGPGKVYEYEDISSLDELLEDSAVYQAFRKRYDNIVEFNHEYSFWGDDSILFGIFV